jgi:5-hydroxyisourate hydrolase-like protein (transthyretin family)
MSILGIGLLLFQVQLGNVSGIVTKPGSNDPLSGATVMLNPVVSTQTSRLRFTISEDDGRFTIPEIEPGEYRLEVQSPRYGTAAYGQRKPDGPGAILKIGAGQRLPDLKLTMSATGAIAGRITGRSGEPLAYATVQALKYRYQEGKRILAVAQTTTTDDRGDYRLFWLSSGKYIIVAGLRSSPVGTGAIGPLRPGEMLRTGIVIPPRNTTSDALLEGSNLTQRLLEDGSIQEESWMPTYYPATTDRAQATAVDVTAGSTVTGVNITLGPSPVQKIRGRVTGFTGQTTVSLASATQGMIGQIGIRGPFTTDGSFEFAGVLPGLYSLMAQDRAGLVSTPIAVLVGDRDVENLAIALEPAITLSVRLTTESVTPGFSDSFNGLAGTLRPVMDALQGGSPGNLRSPNFLLGAGNAMPFTNVPPGDYQFQISQPALLRENVKPLYIKSIRLGGEDAMDSFHLSSDSARVLDVVLTAEPGSVEGVAIGRSGDPAANVTVVLVPTNARKRMALYQALVTGSDGKFRFQEIPPGDYKLFAWEDIETGAWANAEFIRTYESRGRAVRVSESSKEEVQLNVIYNP